MIAIPSTAQRLFVSYCHEDEKWLRRLLVHLAPLLRHEPIEVWCDTHLAAGDDWRGEIDRAIRQASIALLLVSPDFLASDFIARNELPPLLVRAQAGGLRILWLAVSHSSFSSTDIAAYQALNDPKRPLKGLKPVEVDRVLVEVCGQILSATRPDPASGRVLTESFEAMPREPEPEFWNAVEQYRVNAPIEQWKQRAAVDVKLAAAGPILPASRLSQLLEEAPHDPEIQMAVAVVLGACVSPDDAQPAAHTFVQLLRSPFERARFRAAGSIRRHVEASARSAVERPEVAAALMRAIARERSTAMRLRLLSAQEAVAGE